MIATLRNIEPATPLETLLASIAETLDVPSSAYEQANNRYSAVGDWLCRDGSSLQSQNPVVYPQGSIALGTIVRPLRGDDYDVDAVVELDGPQQSWEPAELKRAIGSRLRESEVYAPMLEPEGRRCWTLQYAGTGSEHGFHMDLLPGVPAGASPSPASTAIAITNRGLNRRVEWRESDPKRYASWFRDRMRPVSARLLTDKVAGVEAIPHFAERVPLQHVVQLLKRYRDVLFQSNDAHAPISVIITTLAAHAYQGEETLEDSLVGVLARMSNFVEREGNRITIRNPVRPSENFADRWEGDRLKERAFLQWLDAADRLRYQLQSAPPDELATLLNNVLGESSSRTILAKYAAKRASDKARTLIEIKQRSAAPKVGGLARRVGGTVSAWLSLLTSAVHREPVCWPVRLDGTGLMIRGTVLDSRGAFRGVLASGDTLDIGTSVRFEAITTRTDALFWQVTNTGSDAQRANQLRGRFESGTADKDEIARYRGTHFVECFAVRNGTCVARSGEFIVNVR